MISGRSRMWRRVPRWTIAVGDQALVAVGNLLMSITVTRVAGVSALGRFAVVSMTILLCMTVSRILVSDPWLASRTASKTPDAELRWLITVSAAATAVVIAGVVLVSCGGDSRWLVASAIGPVFIFQDFGRYVAFRSEAPARAFGSDGSALVAGTLLFVVVAFLGSTDLMTVLIAWLTGVSVGAVVAARRLAGWVKPSGSRAWWLQYCRPLAGKLALDGAGYVVGVTGSLYLLAYLANQRDVGMVRIVQTMFSPAGLTITGLNMWLVPFLANRNNDAGRFRLRLTLWLAAGSGVVLIAALVLGRDLARLVFGVSDAPPELAILLAGLSPCAMAVAAPWVAGARVTGNFLPVAWARALAAVVTWSGLLLVQTLRAPSGYLGLLAFQDVMIAVVAVTVGRRSPLTDFRQISRLSSDPVSARTVLDFEKDGGQHPS